MGERLGATMGLWGAVVGWGYINIYITDTSTNPISVISVISVMSTEWH